MAWTLGAFDAIPWAQGGHPLEQKKVAGDGLSLLLFEPGFIDPNWCRRSHILFVLQGTLCFAFDDDDGERVAVCAGQSMRIEAGTPHQAYVDGGAPAVVFIASDVEGGSSTPGRSGASSASHEGAELAKRRVRTRNS